MHYKLKDYNTFEPLSNKQIEITNIDSKESISNTTNANGEVVFTIKENERGDFFHVRLINDNEYEQNPYYLAKEYFINSQGQKTAKQSTQKILTPNNYPNHPATLYFKGNISLYFNGYTLSILQGKHVIESFEARSGKALSKEEKEGLVEKYGYQHFITHSDMKGCNNIFCLDEEWQKQDEGAIPEGTYYINNIEDTTQIYTDEACSCLVESKTRRKNLCIYVADDNSRGIQIERSYMSSLRKVIQAQATTSLIVEYVKKSQHNITFIMQTENGLDVDEDMLDISAPFAPGTYIELEAESLKDKEEITWGYVLAHSDECLYPLLKEQIKIDEKIFTKITLEESNNRFHEINEQEERYLSYQIGFSLPLLEHESEDSKNHIIIFAFKKRHQNHPTLDDPHIVINMGFEVGEDNNGNIIESKREEQSEGQQALYYQTSTENIEVWNKIQRICNVEEAVNFLMANRAQFNKFYENNKQRYEQKDENGNPIYYVWLDYFKSYPQLAGKIAYIYYRFDVGDEKFVESVKQTCFLFSKCKDEYIKDREEFVRKAKNVYTGVSLCNALINMPNLCNIINPNARNYQQEFEEAFIRENKKIDKEALIRAFIKDVGEKLGIENKFMPEVVFEADEYAGLYQRHKNILSIALPNINKEKYDARFEFVDLMDTIIHEFRHFYIYHVFEDVDNRWLTGSDLAKFIYFSLYVSSKYHIIFDAYDKECASFDAEVGQCGYGLNFIEKENHENKESEGESKPSPLYYIQPKERDARVVAGKFRQEAGIKS